MSCWTRAYCIVRVPRKVDIKSIFGREFEGPKYPSYNLVSCGEVTENEYEKLYNEWKEAELKNWDEYEKDPDSFVPTGSEGSLHYHEPEQSRDGRWEYKISGNLRDWSSEEEIIKWFRDKFLHWINTTDINKDYEVYGWVSASFVGTLTWEYGENELGD